jgi:hypothetical protein
MKRNSYVEVGFVLALSTILLSSPAVAQSTASSSAAGQSSPGQPAGDQSSLGDYARKVRKDPVAKAKPKVFDNDNLPMDDKISVVGQPATVAAADAAVADSKDAAAKPATSADDEKAKKQAAWKAWQDKLSAQKDAIDLASRELDVLTREYELRAAVMYADTGNRLRNSTQWDKEDAEYKQKIADKTKAVDDAKQKLDDMKEEARKAGVPSAMIE